jgi:hypothetical protein
MGLIAVCAIVCSVGCSFVGDMMKESSRGPDCVLVNCGGFVGLEDRRVTAGEPQTILLARADGQSIDDWVWVSGSPLVLNVLEGSCKGRVACLELHGLMPGTSVVSGRPRSSRGQRRVERPSFTVHVEPRHCGDCPVR